MAEPCVNHMRRLPQEIKSFIVEFATSDLEVPRDLGPNYVGQPEKRAKKTQREALAKLRLVRPLKEAAESFLFREITVQAFMTAQEWSTHPFTCGIHVRTLKMATIEYEDLSFDEYYLQTLGYYRSGPEHPIMDDDHEKQGFDTYCELANEHLKTLEAEVCPAHLTALLRSIPHLQKVILTGDQRELLRNYRVDYWDCNLSGCTESEENHELLAVAPRAGLLDLGSDYLQILIKALSDAESPVQELAVYGEQSTMALDHHALNMPETHLQYTMNVFSRLESLELMISAVYDMADIELPGFTKGSSPIARVLSYAKKLQYLRLTTEEDWLRHDMGDFRTIMLGCVLPNLKACTIRCWTLEAEDLLDFLQGSPKLDQLRLFHIAYKSGSVDDVLKVLGQRRPTLVVEISP
ncbi:MAG: hypothetical protein Q9204_006232 [Flavoplaca sp. TL-2023a]